MPQLRQTSRALGRAIANHKPLTVEEARKLHDIGTLERLVAELREGKRLSDIAKEHANASSRQDTQVKKAIKAYALAEDLQNDDRLLIDDHAYWYDVTHTEKIDPKGLLEMLRNGEITDGEFLSSISVNKVDAERTIGQHKLQRITTETAGKKLDLRKQKLDTPVREVTIQRGAKAQIKKPRLNSEAHASAPPPPRKPKQRPGASPVLKVKRSLKIRK